MQEQRKQTIRDTLSIGKPDIKLEGMLPPSPPPVKDFPTIDIQDDHDIKFPTIMFYFADDDQSMFEEINVELDINGSESVHSFIGAPATNVDVN